VDKEHSKKICIALAVKALGWAAFGTSLTGGMVGSDIVYFESSASTNSGSNSTSGSGSGSGSNNLFMEESMSSAVPSHDESTTIFFLSFGGNIHDDHALDYNG
jgi:hypothetical protein